MRQSSVPPVTEVAEHAPIASNAPIEPFHAVQFYENEHFLAAAVGDYLAQGLSVGDAVVAIATAPHREQFRRRIETRGIDADLAVRNGQLVWLDARETLSTFMSAAAPDPARFRSHVGGIIRDCLNAADRRHVRAFGEMVDLLWRDGNVESAVRLEDLWNELQRELCFSLLCAYPMGNFHMTLHAQSFDRMCRSHDHVLPTERYVDMDEADRLREVSVLQQRARCLESEIEHRNELEQRLRIALAAKVHAEEELKRSLSDRDALLERERVARAEAESASRAKNEFLAVMSHELRTPLNAIGGHVQLLEMGIHGPVVEAQREALLRIERSQRHLLALINDILNLTRIEAGRVKYALENVRLEPLVLEVKAMLDPLVLQHQLTLDLATIARGTRGIAVRADREKAQQILLNMLSNAIKFTPPGGQISITCGRGSDPQRGANAFIEVRDTGIGIAPAKLETIFQPFVQLAARASDRPDGVGLGLSISRELARGMGGDLTGRSSAGEGATFTLTLPTVSETTDAR